MLFTGEFDHTIDAKGRMAIPSEIRSRMTREEDGEAFYLTIGSNRALRLYPEKGFERLAAMIEEGLVTDEAVQEFDQLLFPLLLESSNESAEALARVAGRERFIKLMNDKARAIGMTDTRFADPSGISASNISTAEDIFTLAKYIESNRSFIFKLTAGDLTTSAYGAPSFPNLQNLNDFGADPRFLGGKVGLATLAGETAVYVFRVNIAGEERRVALVLLGASDRVSDARLMLDYITTQFQ